MIRNNPICVKVFELTVSFVFTKRNNSKHDVKFLVNNHRNSYQFRITIEYSRDYMKTNNPTNYES